MIDASDPDERAGVMGRLGMYSGIGTVIGKWAIILNTVFYTATPTLIGPALSGYMTSLSSEQFTTCVAAVIPLVCVVIVIVTIPKTRKNPSRSVEKDPSE